MKGEICEAVTRISKVVLNSFSLCYLADVPFCSLNPLVLQSTISLCRQGSVTFHSTGSTYVHMQKLESVFG